VGLSVGGIWIDGRKEGMNVYLINLCGKEYLFIINEETNKW
jgi:hypothetical protein